MPKDFRNLLDRDQVWKIIGECRASNVNTCRFHGAYVALKEALEEGTVEDYLQARAAVQEQGTKAAQANLEARLRGEQHVAIKAGAAKHLNGSYDVPASTYDDFLAAVNEYITHTPAAYVKSEHVETLADGSRRIHGLLVIHVRPWKAAAAKAVAFEKIVSRYLTEQPTASKPNLRDASKKYETLTAGTYWK